MSLRRDPSTSGERRLEPFFSGIANTSFPQRLLGTRLSSQVARCVQGAAPTPVHFGGCPVSNALRKAALVPLLLAGGVQPSIAAHVPPHEVATLARTACSSGEAQPFLPTIPSD